MFISTQSGHEGRKFSRDGSDWEAGGEERCQPSRRLVFSNLYVFTPTEEVVGLILNKITQDAISGFYRHFQAVLTVVQGGAGFQRHFDLWSFRTQLKLSKAFFLLVLLVAVILKCWIRASFCGQSLQNLLRLMWQRLKRNLYGSPWWLKHCPKPHQVPDHI